MAMNVQIILSIGFDSGPFDLDYSADGISWTNFDTSVPSSSLTGGTYIASVPDTSQQIRATSLGDCTNSVDLVIQPSGVC